MKTIQFAKLKENKSLEFIGILAVTEEELNLLVKSEGYTQNFENQYSATDNLETKIIRVLN